MNNKYKNSYIVKEKELVSLSVYNVGFQSCDQSVPVGTGYQGSLSDSLYHKR